MYVVIVMFVHSVLLFLVCVCLDVSFDGHDKCYLVDVLLERMCSLGGGEGTVD